MVFTQGTSVPSLHILYIEGRKLLCLFPPIADSRVLSQEEKDAQKDTECMGTAVKDPLVVPWSPPDAHTDAQAAEQTPAC